MAASLTLLNVVNDRDRVPLPSPSTWLECSPRHYHPLLET
jgi:hypothetical protein